MTITRRVLVSAALLAGFSWTGFSAPGSAAEPGKDAGPARPAHELALAMERVIIFKDGYHLIIKRGKATSNAEGDVFTEDVPDAAVLGSFWAVSGKAPLKGMTAGWQTTKTEISRLLPCTQTLELVSANLGKTAKVELGPGRTYEGTLKEVLSDPATAALADPLRTTFGLADASDEASRSLRSSATPSGEPREAVTVATQQGSSFILRTESGDVVIPAAQVQTMQIKEMVTKLDRKATVTRHSKRLTLQCAKGNEPQDILLMYFSPGMRWIPTYRVDLHPAAEKKTATITLQAEILNESESLAKVPVDIVVGVPNFRFKESISPLSLETALRNVAHAMPQVRNDNNNYFGNSMLNGQMMSQQMPARQNDAVAVDDSGLALPPELTTTGTQDLFIYHLGALTLKKGERMAQTIFTDETTYRDVYTWESRVRRHDFEAAPSGAGIQSPLAISRNEVWHQIELGNKTKLPWTTGAVLVVQDRQPLSQELLTYTSSGSSVRIPLTIAVETRGNFNEKETARDLKGLDWEGAHYAKITKQGKLELKNNKTEAIEVEITLRTGGKCTEASNDGQITLGGFDGGDWENYRGHPAINNSSTIRWQTKIAPGATFAPTVSYFYYSRY